MAQVYATPIPAPDFNDAMVSGRFNDQRYRKLNAAFIEQCRDWLKQNGYTSPLAGKIVRFPVADGYAEYMIVSLRPVTLMHLPFGDSYQIPEAHARGLRASDLRELVEREEKWARLSKGTP
jgi:hypothetical protein